MELGNHKEKVLMLHHAFLKNLTTPARFASLAGYFRRFSSHRHIAITDELVMHLPNGFSRILFLTSP
ncbi:hypothetical protein L3X38_022260 [Prunus dulcis]|uniref:Uncharacterized protein n=1 Tax=Prunus dulcis TaxID=3755 RepID=A0AAD4VYD6_PRUDU|nr:hypothetical protein L3X38_022260 [Prunus dulcis]